jgi:tRNA 2-selenouridine synthase
MSAATPSSQLELPSIEIEEALACADARIVDLRSPAEFAGDHLPSAVNHPLFGDAERELIGTLYKQVSPEAAYERATVLVKEGVGSLLEELSVTAGRERPQSGVEELLRALTGEGFGSMTREINVSRASVLPARPLIVHCWRAGLRSQSVAALLQGLGWGEVLILEGGYKSYRRHVIESLEEAELPISFVLRGLTGVGKTLVLRELERIRPGWALDLELHAKHRSSILGMVGLEPVSQRSFEGDLATRLRCGFPADLVVFEGESRKVGDRVVPERIWDSLVAGQNIKLTTSTERRVEVLAQDYLSAPNATEQLLKQLPFIEERLGPKKWKGVLTDLLLADRISELVEALLEHYYDPLYLHSEKGREHSMELDSTDPTACAEEVAEWIGRAKA